MADLYVVQSKIRELAKKANLRMSGDAVEVISKRVEGIVKEAGARAKGNKRQTIKSQDI